MRGKSSCRKHNIHSRQPPEQHKTKTRKQHECKWLQKHRRHTETNKRSLRERWEYRLGTVSDTYHGGLKTGLWAPNLTIIPSVPYKKNSVNKRYPRPITDSIIEVQSTLAISKLWGLFFTSSNYPKCKFISPTPNYGWRKTSKCIFDSERCFQFRRVRDIRL